MAPMKIALTISSIAIQRNHLGWILKSLLVCVTTLVHLGIWTRVPTQQGAARHSKFLQNTGWPQEDACSPFPASTSFCSATPFSGYHLLWSFCLLADEAGEELSTNVHDLVGQLFSTVSASSAGSHETSLTWRDAPLYRSLLVLHDLEPPVYRLGLAPIASTYDVGDAPINPWDESGPSERKGRSHSRMGAGIVKQPAQRKRYYRASVGAGVSQRMKREVQQMSKKTAESVPLDQHEPAKVAVEGLMDTRYVINLGIGSPPQTVQVLLDPCLLLLGCIAVFTLLLSPTGSLSLSASALCFSVRLKTHTHTHTHTGAGRHGLDAARGFRRPLCRGLRPPARSHITSFGRAPCRAEISLVLAGSGFSRRKRPDSSTADGFQADFTSGRRASSDRMGEDRCRRFRAGFR